MNLQDWEIVTDWYEHDPDMNEDERLETENAVRASIEHLIRVEGVIPSQGDFIADFSGKLHGAEIAFRSFYSGKRVMFFLKPDSL